MEELNSLSEAPNLWDNPNKAQKLMSERNVLDNKLTNFNNINKELNDLIEISELAEMEDDNQMLDDAYKNLSLLLENVKKQELEALLSGEADSNDCFLEVHSGSGGTEACDWAEMLLRMYSRWAGQHNCKVEYVEETAGDVAGIKSATIKISGLNSYGWLKSESGVHRLVRISPFDSNARRHTSFASIWVYPVVDDTIEVDLQDKDCRVDTYRASGAGGQHVNKTDSAVRITHIPTGIVVQCQNQRSQLQNRESCWKMLKARLYELELKNREEKSQEVEAGKSDIGWGHQIRSYVLQPYQMVKDLRTGAENTDSKAVLDGDIDKFLAASLASKLSD